MSTDRPSSSGSGRIQLHNRLWLQDGGTPMFGPGTYELLVRVSETGSLHRSAQQMAMSYSKAWRIVREAEQHFGVLLLERHAGGAAGGGSVLTDDGRALVERFGGLMNDVQVALDVLFAKHFDDLPFVQGRGPAEPTA